MFGSSAFSEEPISAAVPTSSTLSPALFTNVNTFYTPNVLPLRPALYVNLNSFGGWSFGNWGDSAWGGDRTSIALITTILPARYNNTNTFYTATVVASNTLAPALYTGSYRSCIENVGVGVERRG